MIEFWGLVILELKLLEIALDQKDNVKSLGIFPYTLVINFSEILRLDYCNKSSRGIF